MQLQYGGYTHQPGECQIAISREGIFSDLGKQYAVKERWDVLGLLTAIDTDHVNSAIADLMTAYSHNGYDLVFAGTVNGMRSSDTLNGVRVVTPPSFPEGRGAEFSTYRHYHLALEAEFPYDLDGDLLSWTQNLSYRGTGGPVWKYQEYLNGPPVQQILQQYSVCHVTQHGSATGSNGIYITPPGPIWPWNEHQDQRQVTPELPSDLYGKRVINWTYVFSFAYAPGNVVPTPPPAMMPINGQRI